MGASDLPLELLEMIIEHVDMARDLARFLRVNSTWHMVASRKLYRGSVNDMQFRTPEIETLMCHYVASRNRLTRNMTFVKHMLLSPEIPTVDVSAFPHTRLSGYDKSCSVRYGTFAEHLVNSFGGRLESLAIPFEFMGRTWEGFTKLLFRQSIKFLIIDGKYCEVMLNSHFYTHTIKPYLDGDLPNIKALTIYRSDCRQSIKKLCEFIDCCDLQFFQLEHVCTELCLSPPESLDIFRSLRRHRNLKLLSLVMYEDALSVGLSHLMSFANEESKLWPGLRALELKTADEDLLEQLPEFKELQILSLHSLDLTNPDIGEIAVQNIAKCRKLLAMEVVIPMLDSWDVLADIAHGCPQLRKFSVWLGVKQLRLLESTFLDIVRSLPHLEILELNLNFRMDAEIFQEVARTCPRLTVFDMPDCMFCLIAPDLENFRPFRHLEAMTVSSILLEPAHIFLAGDQFPLLLKEWRRVFPKLRGMPCPGDMHISPALLAMLDDESEEDRMSLCHNILNAADADNESDETNTETENEEETGNENEPPAPPSTIPEECKTDWFKLRMRLWRALGYRADPTVHVQVQSMWRTNIQIETVGWPVMPLEAYSSPIAYSTSTNEGQLDSSYWAQL